MYIVIATRTHHANDAKAVNLFIAGTHRIIGSGRSQHINIAQEIHQLSRSLDILRSRSATYWDTGGIPIESRVLEPNCGEAHISDASAGGFWAQLQ